MSRLPTPHGVQPPPPVDSIIRDFLASHPGWSADFSPGAPVYALPQDAIDPLSRSIGGRSVPLLTVEQAAAEAEFTRLCVSAHAVGSRLDGVPISYPYLAEATPPPTRELMLANGFNTAQIASIERAVRHTAAAHDRMRGVVGWLLTEPMFIEERDALRVAWECTPAAALPHGPFVLAAEATTETLDLGHRLNRFLNRWGLTGMATWDLPVPQGPLLPDPLPPNAPASPTHGVHLFIPTHYPLLRDDPLLGRVREYQRNMATDLRIEPGFGSIAHHATYAQMFRLMHLERTVGHRAGGQLGHGRVAPLAAAAAEHLGVDGDRVRKLRLYVRRCLRGERYQIRELRLPR